MTEEMKNRRAFLEKTPDTDILRETGFAAERLIELEVSGGTGARHGERSLVRLAQRSGHRDGDWETRAGMVELRIPSCSNGSTARSNVDPSRRHLPQRPGDHKARPRHPPEQNGEWAIQRAQYMTLETVAALGDDSLVGLPAMAI
jgi:Transposase, Mutator family